MRLLDLRERDTTDPAGYEIPRGDVDIEHALATVLMVIGGIAMGTGLALQGKGHKLERVPPEPFTGPANAIARLLLEQWVTFPRFVLSGGWRRALKRSV